MADSNAPHRANLQASTAARPTEPILLVEDDRELADLVKTILEEEGFSVAILDVISDEAIRGAVEQLRPGCVLLDGAEAPAYAQAWATAATLQRREPPVRTVMFTADARAAQEARDVATTRAIEAGFAAVITKPFTIQELVGSIETVLSRRVADTPQ